MLANLPRRWVTALAFALPLAPAETGTDAEAQLVRALALYRRGLQSMKPSEVARARAKLELLDERAVRKRLCVTDPLAGRWQAAASRLRRNPDARHGTYLMARRQLDRRLRLGPMPSLGRSLDGLFLLDTRAGYRPGRARRDVC